jgi:hypothetical protein
MNYIGNIKILSGFEAVYKDKDGNFFFKHNGRFKDANWISKEEIFNVYGYIYR